MILSWGSVMRYGSCKSQAPALLAGGVVARPQGRKRVAPPRLAEASPPLHLGAVDRAVALPAVAPAADDHPPVAPRAVQHPVALLDDRAPATEAWTPEPPPAILTASVASSLRRWPRSPGPLVTPLQAWASSSRWRPCSTEPMGSWSRDRRSRGHRRRPSGLRSADPLSGNQIQARTTSTACAWREPNPGHAPRREPHPGR